MTENEIRTRVIDPAIAEHRELGPGLLETVYEVVLARELTERGLRGRAPESRADHVQGEFWTPLHKPA
jgi:GxxExxY protein